MIVINFFWPSSHSRLYKIFIDNAECAMNTLNFHAIPTYARFTLIQTKLLTAKISHKLNNDT